MSNINKQALRIPERKKHNWSQAVMRDCDFCQQWALTVQHADGGCICASCCDSEYTSDLKVTLAAALEKLEATEKRIAELEVLAFSPAILDVISERQRQRSVEGWSSERDDAYQNSELADAAACYAIHAHNQSVSTPAHWPWGPVWWKQTNPRRDLVKAGALILAEVERIDRAAGIITKVGE